MGIWYSKMRHRACPLVSSERASGLVSRVLSGTAIYLERASPRVSSTQPGCAAGHRIASLFALAPDGVYQAMSLPTCWCALTAPFQLFSRRSGGVFFSVALSVGSPRPAVSWHLALWSPDFPRTPKRTQPSGPLAWCILMPKHRDSPPFCMFS